MGEYVSVESFEALRRFRVALCQFAETVGVALYEAEAEMQRARHWVKLEQSNYWKKEKARRAELLTQAKNVLAMKRLQATSAASRPSCVEEQEAVALAKRRLEEAEQKLNNVHRWSGRIDEEILAYQTVASGMQQALTVEIPKALAKLDNMLASLAAYAPSGTPQAQVSAVAAGGEAGEETEDADEDKDGEAEDG